MKSTTDKKEPKVKAIESIWAMSVGLFAICIPLVAITESGILLPLLVLLSASSGTAFVWWSPNRQRPDKMELEALEARIIDLETIVTHLPSVDEAKLLADPNP